MAFRTEFSERAVADLDEILRYMCEDLCNHQAAERFFLTVNEKLELIGENPYMYPLHHDEKLNAEGYRFVVVENYLLFYVLSDVDSVASTVRIVYGGRDFSAVFQMQDEGR